MVVFEYGVIGKLHDVEILIGGVHGEPYEHKITLLKLLLL